jgi:hypothetical protein
LALTFFRAKPYFPPRRLTDTFGSVARREAICMTVTRSIDSVGSDTGRVSRPDLPRITSGRLLVATVLACSLAATGCQSGMSMTKPSWWKFGGGGSGDDAAKLAAAPSFSTDAKKPSEANSPYPTTSTPNGYVITGSSAAGSAPATQAATSIGPVVYGSAPPASTAAVSAAAPGSAPVASSQGGAAAQTGPYATLGGETIPPPGQPLPPIAPLSNPVAQPATASLEPQAAYPAAASQAAVSPAAGPAYRTADASASAGYSNFSAAAGSEPPAAAGMPAGGAAPGGMPAAGMAPAGMTPAGMTSAGMAGGAMAGAAVGSGRYGTQSASRFSTGGSTPAAPASYGQPQTDTAFPPPDAVLPAGAQPAAAPLAPPATPGLLPQSTTQPPVRRPDPGYRPFDTGSYRPSSTILAQESGLVSGPAPGRVSGPASGAVRTVSFEESAAGTITSP